ncbi:hypothetical protein CN603_15835 [Bacillus toyonensis]|uniref:hypothetical protein n=1 Tax=Bacillus toyonensis TaxID=155322 RepID=UPI000BF0726F|nr:hypothetical protein [Bacillus toyonensis]PEL74420.1 hypothetical protein CN603_15835 [Bacillus toyonensis]
MEIKNHCIYLQDEQSKFTYNSGEHIIPAGLGGIQKLPGGYVSDLCNNTFSGIETEFMRRSLLALPRQFLGPGKRGKLNPREATKSGIGFMWDGISTETIELSYISLGDPYALPQLKINTKGNIKFSADKSLGDTEQILNNFFNQLKKFDNKYTIHEDTRIDKETFLIGYEKDEKRWHLAFHEKTHNIDVQKWIERVLNPEGRKFSKPEYRSMQAEVTQQFTMDLEAHERVYAKIAFNFLAYVKGQDFVLQECFNPVRNWILKGGDNNFVESPINDDMVGGFKEIPLPELCHKIFLFNIDNDLVAFLSFYGGQFGAKVILGKDFSGDFDMDGFICDWKNREEYRIFDYLHKIDNGIL